MRLNHIVSLACLAVVLIFADSPARAAQTGVEAVAPLGFAIGQATRKQVEDGLGGKVRLKNHGTNRYSGGVMLTGAGAGLGVDGLKEVTFLFNEREILAGMVMDLDKGGFNSNFDRIYEYLAAKYPLVQKQLPAVGNRYVRFQKGDIVIELEARHMSFTMNLSYLTDELEKRYRSMRSKESDQKRTRERGQF